MELLQEYYRILDKKLVTANDFASFFGAVFAERNAAFVSDNRYYRKILNIIKKRTITGAQAREKAELFLPLYQLFFELGKRGVPCYIFSRPNAKKSDSYSPLARERMENGLSFPKMSEAYPNYKQHFDEILREKSSEAYVCQLRQISQIICRGGLYGHEDVASQLLNIVNGRRIVTGSVSGQDKKVHMYGRCGVFGYAVEDCDSLPSRLQGRFNNAGMAVQVVNHGLWGADDALITNNMIVESAAYTENDIIVLYESGPTAEEELALRRIGVCCYDCTEPFHADPRSSNCFYDRPGHMSADGYDAMSQFIFQELMQHHLRAGQCQEDAPQPQADYTAKFLQREKKDQFSENLSRYLEGIQQEHPLVAGQKVIGAVVMNCNPFTFGHRYLIEYASKKADRLYVFVLQEDQSFFSFEDRFELVKQGTADLSNVIVLPSGEFMISALTFPEYFMKEYKKSKDFDATHDLYTFGHFIAPALNISVRFAGEEPMDIVTRAYNDSMRTLLPQMGVSFCEIPRKTVDDGQIVSASHVRALMKQGKWEEIQRYVPQTTFALIMRKYRGA